MAQQFKKDEATRPIKREGAIRPQEDVTVYATDKAKHYTSGEAVTMHKALAEKMIEQGKMTADKPAEAKTKGGQK